MRDNTKLRAFVLADDSCCSYLSQNCELKLVEPEKRFLDALFAQS